MTGHERMETLADYWTARLAIDGYCVIPDLVPPGEIAEIDGALAADFDRTPFCEGRFYGEQTKRFGRLLTRAPASSVLVQHGLVMAIVERVLGPACDRIQLNLTQAIAIHPGAMAQMPHRDQDMWRVENAQAEYLVNVMWPFTPYRLDNGATRVWRGSHGQKAFEAMSDVNEASADVPEYGPGSALLMLGSTLHAAGANRTNQVRRGMIVGYSLGWLRSYENQFLAYPPEVARHFTPELAALIGYRQHRPNLGNFEGRCPSVLLGDPPFGPMAAADALRPDQIEAVETHAAVQRRIRAALAMPANQTVDR